MKPGKAFLEKLKNRKRRNRRAFELYAVTGF
jgi:hypothetical protein